MRSSVFIAIGLAVALGAWLSSPYLLASNQHAIEQPITQDNSPAERPLFSVRTRVSKAEEVAQTVVSHGKTAPAREVELRAEIEGRVVKLPAARGSDVREGDTIVELDQREKRQMLNQAKASLEQRRVEYEAAKRLGAKGFQAETAVAKALADLELAKAMLQQEIIAIDHTRIKAPFAGILESRPVEIGDFLKVGELAATVLEMDPLIVEADLPEAVGTSIRPGMIGSAQLVTGEKVEGQLRYVSHRASEGTRTFKIEMEIPNPEGALPAGVSATLVLDLQKVYAHPLPSSLLSLDDQGRIGVKYVDIDNVVRFAEADIVKSTQNTVWLSGLPEQVRVITVGQGFVRNGQKVEPKSEHETGKGQQPQDHIAQRNNA